MQLLTLAVASGVTVSPAIGRAVSFLRQGSLPTWGYRFLASPFSLLPNSSRSESPLSPKVQGAPSASLAAALAGRRATLPGASGPGNQALGSCRQPQATTQVLPSWRCCWKPGSTLFCSCFASLKSKIFSKWDRDQEVQGGRGKWKYKEFKYLKYMCQLVMNAYLITTDTH